MKNKILLIMLCLSLSGCATCMKEVKHYQSDMFGLDRDIVLYASDGSVIKKWHTKAKVEINGSTASWLDENGKEVKISGTFIVVEN